MFFKMAAKIKDGRPMIVGFFFFYLIFLPNTQYFSNFIVVLVEFWNFESFLMAVKFEDGRQNLIRQKFEFLPYFCLPYIRHLTCKILIFFFILIYFWLKNVKILVKMPKSKMVPKHQYLIYQKVYLPFGTKSTNYICFLKFSRVVLLMRSKSKTLTFFNKESNVPWIYQTFPEHNLNIKICVGVLRFS